MNADDDLAPQYSEDGRPFRADNEWRLVSPRPAGTFRYVSTDVGAMITDVLRFGKWLGSAWLLICWVVPAIVVLTYSYWWLILIVAVLYGRRRAMKRGVGAPRHDVSEI